MDHYKIKKGSWWTNYIRWPISYNTSTQQYTVLYYITTKLLPQKFFFTVETADEINLMDFVFTPEDIITAISDLKTNESPDPDGIPAVLLKECKNELATPIYLLWRESLNSGEFPSCLKEGWVVSIFKSGSRVTPKNYCPVTPHITYDLNI